MNQINDCVRNFDQCGGTWNENRSMLECYVHVVSFRLLVVCVTCVQAIGVIFSGFDSSLSLRIATV